MGNSRKLIGWEVAALLLTTFGMSGFRSALSLIQGLLSPVALNEQTVSLNGAQGRVGWIDFLLRLASDVALFAWGGLALVLLALTGRRVVEVLKYRGSDWGWGLVLAAVIGLPGLGLYAAAVHWGFSRVVDVASGAGPWWAWILFVVSAWANAWAEELVVVCWLSDRLRRLGLSGRWRILCSAVLRGSYHLYQGPSAGLGNVCMGVVYAGFYEKKRRLWPLIIGHGVIDTVAFVGAAVLEIGG